MFVLIFIFIHTDLLPNVLQILSLRKKSTFQKKKPTRDNRTTEE